MAQSNVTSFKEKLVNRKVIVKLSLFTRPFSGTITAVDDTGFCLVSNEMNVALGEVTGRAMAEMDAPSVYLPFSQLEWLISSQPKAAAASA
jgi:small nuclear ribonucleoprotein (snRNP)-like protein